MCVKRRFLAIFLVLSMLLGLTGISTAAAVDFTDLPNRDDWSYAALDAAVKNGLLKGIDGKILPGAAVSRAQFAAILSRAFGATAQADVSGYTDAAKSDWYYADMARAVGMKALAGSGELLRPEELITRQETFVALARALKLAPGSASALDAYTDGAQVAPWAVEGVAVLAGGKYIEGANGILNPLGTITRAELAQVLYKLIPAYVSTAGTYSEAVTGNLMVNAPGVTLKGITIPGDLILGDGVGEGDVTLSGVTVHGRLVIRGGGGNSIHIADKSAVGSVVMGKTGAGAVRLLSESGSKVAAVDVGDSGGKVVLQGGFDAVTVTSATGVELRDAAVSALNIRAGKAAVALEGKTSVAEAKLDAKAEGATLAVAKGAQITRVDSAAPKAAITGEGKVLEAVVSGNDTKITTVGTKVTVGKNTTGVTAGGKVLVGGETVTIKPSNPSSGGSSGPRTVVNDVEFLSALGSSSVTEVVVGGNVDLFVNASDPTQEGYIITKPVTISGGGSLRIRKWAEFQGTTVTVKSGGTLYVDNNVTIGALGEAAKTSTLDIQSGGIVEVNGELDIAAPSVVINAGTIKVTYYEENDSYATLALLDSNLSGTELLCGAISGMVNGPSVRHMMADTLAAVRTALDKGDNGKPYYSDVFLMPGESGASEVTLSEDLSFGTSWIGEAQHLIIFQGVTFTVPQGITLTIGAKGILHIQGTVDVTAGAVANNGRYYKSAIGILKGAIGGTGTTNYNVEDEDQWNIALADGNCSLINVTGNITVADGDSGKVEKLREIDVTGSGSLTVPDEVELTLGMDVQIFDEATLTIESGGTVKLNGWCFVDSNAAFTVKSGGTLAIGEGKGFLDVYGSFTNAGTATVGEGEIRGNLAKKLANSGTITLTGGELRLAQCVFDNTGGTVNNQGHIRLENCRVTGSALMNIEATDVLNEQDFYITGANVPEESTFQNYGLRITTQEGLEKVMNPELTLPVVGDGDKPYLHIGADFTVTKPITLTRSLDVNGDYDGKAPIAYTVTVGSVGALTINEGVDLNVGNYGALDVQGSVIINGGLSANHWEDGENPAMNDRGGVITTTGTVTNNRDFNVNGGELDFQGGDIIIARDAYMGIRQGGKLTVAGELKIINHGSIEAMDAYNGAGVLQGEAVDVPEREFYVNDEKDEWGNDTGWYTYGAEVWSGDDINAAKASYAFLKVQGADVTWGGGENGVTLPQDVHIQIDNYWVNSVEHQTKLTLSGKIDVHGELCVGGSATEPPKLVIANEASVTVSRDGEGADAHMQNDGIVENNGTITVSGEGAHLGGDDGEFSGNAVDNKTEDDSVVSDGWKTAQAPAPEP